MQSALKSSVSLAAVVALLLAALTHTPSASSQVVGGVGSVGGGGGAFFGPGAGVAYDLEPTAVFTGHDVHVSATVSADNKYVNLNMVPQQTAVLGVQNFIFVTEGGFVGTPGAAGGTTNRPPADPGLRGSSPNPPPGIPMSAPLTGVLARPGMTRLAGL